MKIRKTILSVIVALGLTASARAGFLNGGFESGDFTGWTVEHGLNDGSGVTAFTPDASHAYVVGSANGDTYSPFTNPFDGNYMARLNEFVPQSGAGNYDVTRISQTATFLPGETSVLIRYGAVMEDPGHDQADEPFFSISIYKNGSLFAQEMHTADQGTAGGWIQGTPNGPDGSQIYYSSGVFQVGGLTTGDQVGVVLTVADCALGGHAGWAYLDGIGSNQQVSGVPDGGSSIALLATAFVGVAVLRRRFVVVG